jgi:hypothetical protein
VQALALEPVLNLEKTYASMREQKRQVNTALKELRDNKITEAVIQASLNSEPVQRQYLRQLQVQHDDLMRKFSQLLSRLRFVEPPPRTAEDFEHVCRQCLPTYLCYGRPIYAPPSDACQCFICKP